MSEELYPFGIPLFLVQVQVGEQTVIYELHRVQYGYGRADRLYFSSLNSQCTIHQHDDEYRLKVQAELVDRSVHFFTWTHAKVYPHPRYQRYIDGIFPETRTTVVVTYTTSRVRMEESLEMQYRIEDDECVISPLVAKISRGHFRDFFNGPTKVRFTGFTKIDGVVFDANSNVYEIDFGDFIMRLDGCNALCHNNRLLQAIRGKNVHELAGYIFQGCSRLEVVDLPMLRTCGAGAFRRCVRFDTLVAPNLEFIGRWGFLSSGLVTASFPKLVRVQESAFEGCLSLREVYMPKMEAVPEACFKGCTALQSVTLESVTALNSYCFQYCSQLKTVNLPIVRECIDLAHFEGCTMLEECSLPQITRLSWDMFKDCNRLQRVSFPEVTIITEGAFEHVHSLRMILIPKVMLISTGVFDHLVGVVTVQCPRNQRNRFPGPPLHIRWVDGVFPPLAY